MSNSNNDLSNCRKLLALLDSCFKGAVFGDVKVDELSHSLLQVIELATPPAQPAPVQEPVAWADALFEAIKHGDAEHQNWLQEKLKSWVIVNPPPTPPAAQPAPVQEPVALTDGVTVPLAVLEAAEASLGNFCSDHGWSDEDMQNMDNLSAYIARHKANHGITKGQPCSRPSS